MPETRPSSPPPGRPTDPLLGCVLGGHYKITALLGRGGMSRVYQAVQSPLGRAVALKVLKDDPKDPSLKKRFLFEASVTSRLSHPNTITIFDYGVDKGLLFFAMELLRGKTLSQALKRDGKFSEQRTLHIARQICRSLREAHAHGLVHRDLKPSNFFLVDHADEVDFVKVLDFGLVKLFGKEDLQITSGGVVLGTPHYMAPEQARGQSCDQRSDVYALGVVMFQMLTGKVPYDGPNTVDVLLKHVSEPVPPVRIIAPEVSPELEAVVAKCMSKNPDERYAQMEDLLAAFPGDRPAGPRPPPPPLDDDEPVSGKTTGKLQGVVHAMPPSVTPQPVVAPAPPPASRRGLFIGAAAVGAAAIAAVLFWPRAHKPAQAQPVAAAVAPVAPAPAPVAVSQPVVPPPPAAAPPPREPAPEPVKPAPAPAKRVVEKKVAVVAPAPAARVSQETLDDLDEHLGRIVSGVRQCVMLEPRAPSASEVNVAVTVEPSGHVADVALSGGKLSDHLEKCIRSAASKLKFDAFEGGRTTVKKSVSLVAR